MTRVSERVLEEMYERARRTGQTLSAHFEMTYRCNLKCRHCYIRGGAEELTTAEVKTALEKLASAGTLFITFTGGEPLAREDFFEIASFARELNFAVRIFTNGTLVDAAAADRLAALAPLNVGVSLYGARRETHEFITGIPGSFEKTVNALRLLTGRGVRTTMKSVLMKPNFTEYGAMIGMATAMGAKYMFDATVFPGDDGDRAPLELRIDDAQLETALTDPRLNYRDPGTPATGVCRGPVCDLNTTCIAIDPRGDVFPCLQLRRPVGNIINENFFRSLVSQWAIKGINNLTNGNILKTCYNCNIKWVCTRCPGLALLEDGDVMGPSSWACRIARIRAKVKTNDTGQ